MKKMWRIRKNKEAVSPVIATILMVAITVVLAAVLYVMVMGFGGGGGATPTASFDQVKSSQGYYNWTVISISKADVKLSDVSIVCVPAAGSCDAALTPTLVGATHVGAGDHFAAHFTTLDVQYTITVKYGPTNNAIATLHVTPT